MLLNDRPDWDHYYLQIAKDVASRGTCCRRKVGCVLVDANHDLLNTGYNGKAAELPNCNDYQWQVFADGRPKEKIYPNACEGALLPSGTGLDKCEAIHAEQNALLLCKDIKLIHTCYTTTSPCVTCINLLLRTGCKRVVFPEVYPHPEAQRRWEAAGREWIHLPI